MAIFECCLLFCAQGGKPTSHSLLFSVQQPRVEADDGVPSGASGPAQEEVPRDIGLELRHQRTSRVSRGGHPRP